MGDKQAAGSRQPPVKNPVGCKRTDGRLPSACCLLLTQIWNCSDILAYCFGCGYAAPGCRDSFASRKRFWSPLENIIGEKQAVGSRQ
jgi:hypothetical protein